MNQSIYGLLAGWPAGRVTATMAGDGPALGFRRKTPVRTATIHIDMTQTRASSTEKPAASIDWQTELAAHDRLLRSVVLARVGERQAVDDVMQEVALAAIRQQAPLSDPNKVAGWLYRIAVTQSLQYRRKMGRRRKLVNRYAARIDTSRDQRSGSDPLRWLLSEERRELIRRAMSSMIPKDAEILMLKYTEGYSYKQLADLLGISVSAIEARLHRARLRLRQHLAAMEVIECK